MLRRLVVKNGIHYATVRDCTECPFRAEHTTQFKVIENGTIMDEDYLESAYRYPCSLDRTIYDTPDHKIPYKCPMKDSIICVSTKPMDSYDIKELLKRED